jgi:phospholipid/cholesterol/gamma-HCH transport system substrate-binding protein
MLRTLRENIRYLAAIFALFAVAAAVSAFILIHERLPVPWDDRYTVRAEFLTAQAITPGQGQTVTVSGVKVGDVAKVELKDGRAIVSMSMERDKLSSVGENARLLLRPKTPLQDMSIDMDPGPASEPSIGDRLLPVSQTQANVNVDEVLAGLDGDTRNYLSIMLSSFGRGLDSNGVNLRRLFAATSPTTAQLAELDDTLDGRRQDIKELVSHLRGVTGALAEQREAIVQLVQAGNVAFGAIDAEQAPLKRSLDLLPGTLQRANRVITTLTPFTAQLRTTAEDLVPVVRHTGPTLQRLRPLVEAARPAVASLRELTPAAIPLAGDLRTALAELRPSVPQVEQIGRVFRYALNELSYIPKGEDRGYLFWLAWFGHNADSMLSGSDANGSFWRAQVIVSCSNLEPLPGSLALLNPFLAPTQLCGQTP